MQRRKFESAGRIEAVNKLALAGGRIVWLKDQVLVEVEVYITQYSEASFSHSVCPGCARKFYPELYAAKEGGDG